MINNSVPKSPLSEAPFSCLGYDEKYFYYYPHAARVLVRLTPTQHTHNTLLRLAPLGYWEKQFPARSAFDRYAAVDALMRACEAKGVYRENEI